MFVSLAHVDITPSHRDAYLAEMIAFAQRSLDGEPDTLHYQIIQDAADPHRVYVVEGYRDHAAFEAHLQSESAARFLAVYVPHPQDDGSLHFREATTEETAAVVRLWGGTPIFPTEGAA
jgi:quinol monooxygenase YgiN